MKTIPAVFIAALSIGFAAGICDAADVELKKDGSWVTPPTHVPTSLEVSTSGNQVTITGKVENFCGAPLSQGWNIHTFYDAVVFHAANLPKFPTSGATVKCVLFMDCDSDPLVEDNESIVIRADAWNTGVLFNGNADDDSVHLHLGWSYHGNLQSTPININFTISQQHLNTIVTDGACDFILDLLGSSIDDYTPWIKTQEYFTFTITYAFSSQGTAVAPADMHKVSNRTEQTQTRAPVRLDGRSVNRVKRWMPALGGAR